MKSDRVRVKVFERLYKWWFGKSLDFRYSMIPFLGCFFFTYIVWDGSNYISEKQELVSFLLFRLK
jgi:hypothetical protein